MNSRNDTKKFVALGSCDSGHGCLLETPVQYMLLCQKCLSDSQTDMLKMAHRVPSFKIMETDTDRSGTDGFDL